jgi:acetyltransferase-like isoleucine patch superfamily enzyme
MELTWYWVVKSIYKELKHVLGEAFYKFLFSGFGQYCVGKINLLFDNFRQTLFRKKLKYCGQNVSVQFPIVVTSPEMVEFGSDVSLAGYIHIWGEGGIKIGHRVMIGSHTAIT